MREYRILKTAVTMEIYPKVTAVLGSVFCFAEVSLSLDSSKLFYCISSNEFLAVFFQKARTEPEEFSNAPYSDNILQIRLNSPVERSDCVSARRYISSAGSLYSVLEPEYMPLSRRAAKRT